MKINKNQKATFAGGCFWCTEAIFNRLKGVISVTSGYSGGKEIKPDYEKVLSGETGHAEAIQIVFNPEEISYRDLVNLFFQIHDPTQLNRQGADIGSQYRSVIFFHNNEQKNTALYEKEEFIKTGMYQKEIVTEIVPYDNFYKAEEYHQNYYEKNPQAQYCRLIINPKLQKLYRRHSKYTREIKNS